MPGTGPNPAPAAHRPAPEPVLPGERALLDLVGADMSTGMHEPRPGRMNEPVDLFSEAAMAPQPLAASAPAQQQTAPQNDLPGMPLEDLDESVPLDLLPLVPGLIHVKELWSDQAALDAHFASSHIQAWRAAWPALEIGDRNLRVYEVGAPRST